MKVFITVEDMICFGLLFIVIVSYLILVIADKIFTIIEKIKKRRV